MRSKRRLKKRKVKTTEQFNEEEIELMMNKYYGPELKKMRKHGHGKISSPC